MNVPKFPRVTRVPPQFRLVLRYVASEHVCAMYSLAIQMSFPSTAAAA